MYYLAGWFMHLLGASVPIKIARGVGPEFANIAHVAMTGPKLEASVEVLERNTVETRVTDEPARVTMFPTANEAWALRQELSLAGRDAIFEDVLGLANLMRGPK